MNPLQDDRVLVWAIVGSQFAPPFMFSGVAVALPAMGADLNAGATSLGLVETLFLAGSVAFLLPAGRLADAGDKKTLYKLGLLCFGLTSILIGALSSMPAILFIRFLQGATSAVFAATGPAILADLVPAEQRGKAYGSSLGAIYAGLTLGPILAGFLVDTWGWRSVFLAGAATILFGYLLIRSLMPSSWSRPVPAVPLSSTALIVAAMLMLVAGSATLRVGPLGYACLGGGLSLAVVFVALQRRSAEPLLDVVALIHNRVLSNALIVQMLLYVNAFASIFMLSIYIQVSLGHPARVSGQVLAIGSVLMAVMAPVAGALADRHRPGLIASLGVASVLLSTLLALTLDDRSSLAFVVLLLAAQGLGFALFSSPNLTIIMNSVPPAGMSMASALGAKARSLGMVSGMLVTAILVSLDIGNDPVALHPVRFIGVMVRTYSILAVLSALALVVSILSQAPRQGRGGGG